MSLSPIVLLSSAARKQCVENMKQIPTLLNAGIQTGVVDKGIDHKTASVLLPLCIRDGEVCLLYTLRSSKLSSHSGQVSFPGGKMENNESEIETALRETEEEIGVPANQIEVWGMLPHVLSRKGDMLIRTIVGEIKNFDINQLKHNPDEVEEVFTVPMSGLCDENNLGYYAWQGFTLPVFHYKDYKIWGITGFITHLFLQCFLPKNLQVFNFDRKEYKLHDLLPSKL